MTIGVLKVGVSDLTGIELGIGLACESGSSPVMLNAKISSKLCSVLFTSNAPGPDVRFLEE